MSRIRLVSSIWPLMRATIWMAIGVAGWYLLAMAARGGVWCVRCLGWMQ